MPGSGRAALTGQGVSAQGVSAQGVSAQGVSAQGVSAQGVSAQGVSAQGVSAQGVSAQGVSAQGVSAQGVSAQGVSAQGVALLGTDVVAADLTGVEMSSVELRGTSASSPIQPHTLTRGPISSEDPGNYITLATGSAVGHYAVAHLVDPAGAPAEDLDLFIASEQADPAPNLFHRASEQLNDDTTLYTVYFFHKWSGQWMSLCPFNPATSSASAMAIPEDPATPNRFIFACTATGVAAKCARNWGYRPWRSTTTWFFDDSLATPDWVEKEFQLKPYYDACKLAARASYCQDEKSFTKNGTLVDLFDTRQIIWPNAIENPFNAANPDSLWMLAQEYFVSFDPLASTVPMSVDPSLKLTALQRTRYRELSPAGQCSSFAFIDRLEHDHFEDGRWANPLVGTPRIQVFSPNYCTHREDEVGEGLPWDCSPCTKAVCRSRPQCCSSDPLAGGWDATCVAQRTVVCQDVPGGAGPLWTPGKVWPRDAAPEANRPTKFLLGPGGAVERIDGVSTATAGATVVGWTCDPEWPGAALSVTVYGGAPREQPGSVLLGETRADLALALPLAREVSAACDGPNRTTARHGFSFSLPAGLTGEVFVYANDLLSPDGPAAPPTLLRNGIVHLPTCAHSEHLPGAALDATCSDCAATVCDQPSNAICCTTGWDEACTDAAQACTPRRSSASMNGHTFAAVTTGWIEAPSTGSYTFRAGLQPGRVFINGQKLVDWWDGPGPTEGTINLMAGSKYHLRWDRFQEGLPINGGEAGLTWRAPGSAVQTPIPSTALYKLSPGGGSGLQATYFDNPGFAGTQAIRTDPSVDLSRTSVFPAGISDSTYSVIWTGEVIAGVSDTYTFSVVGSGTAELTVGGVAALPPEVIAPPISACAPHDLCAVGDKLPASTATFTSCSPCVDKICELDPYCCNGGYQSYYSTEPVWDAKCVSEVNTICKPLYGLECKNPLPSPTSPEKRSTPLTLQAGVRYPIELKISNGTSDRTVQLLWSSVRLNKQVIPSFALYPPGLPQGTGAGLNVVTFATKSESGVTKPDLDRVLAAGSTPDLTLAPPVGPTGKPLVDVLAGAADATAATPAPPLLSAPPFGAVAREAGPGPAIKVSGIGGVLGGSVRVTVQTTSTDVILPVAADGSFEGLVPVAAFGARTLVLVQRTYPGAACLTPPCAESAPIKWDLTVEPAAPAVPPAPQITTPRDPVANLNPLQNSFPVTGKGQPGPLSVCELGGGTILSSSVTADATGNVTGLVQLSKGTATDPTPGWHKLVFTSQPTCPDPGPSGSKPVFIAVGIRPPTVEFPRSGAEIDCNNPDPRIFDAFGTVPYPNGPAARLIIAEESGQSGLRPVIARQTVVSQTPLSTNPDGSLNFTFTAHGIVLPPGKHLLYFFQAPDLPPTATPAERAAHLRAFASVANTPRSRIEVTIPPPPLQLPSGRQSTILLKTSPLTVGPGDACGPGVPIPSPLCAVPNADVNLRVGGRLFTRRADSTGSWRIDADVLPGFSDVALSQVVDSIAGGGWSESCPTANIVAGLTSGDPHPDPILPGFLQVDALSPAGAPVIFDVGYTPNGSKSVTVTCTPASGSTFPIGATDVRCLAIDNDTKAVGLGVFRIDVVDGPPVIQTPPGGVVAEATDRFGARVSYLVTATDAVSGALPVECAPSAPPGMPAFFPIDQDTPVSCTATDKSGLSTTATFKVRVRDTTPPTLCPLSDLKVNANVPGGAVVAFATCATDVVDGAVPVTCNHPPGFFPLGTTVVNCAATDKHGNKSPASTFSVVVVDNTPPVLKLPRTIDVPATSKSGAKVKYTVTASDDSDPNPVVVCTPPSGSLFPLGSTTVSCTATDASGRKSQGTFLVRVLAAWAGLKLPIDNNGGSLFVRGVPVPVRFELSGASAPIHDLKAHLFIAPLNAAGVPGAERPAEGLPPGVGNLFRFIPLVDDYMLLMNTISMSWGFWQLRVDLGDGVSHTVRVRILL